MTPILFIPNYSRGYIKITHSKTIEPFTSDSFITTQQTRCMIWEYSLLDLGRTADLQDYFQEGALIQKHTMDSAE